MMQSLLIQSDVCSILRSWYYQPKGEAEAELNSVQSRHDTAESTSSKLPIHGPLKFLLESLLKNEG
jgi:hypothetical protein